jgi:signal transduction histidine kinase
MPMTRDECPRLLSLAVHEFRTPVTVVAGYLRMLLKMRAGIGDQPRKLLEEAEKSCARLAALIAELSELSNLDAGHLALDRQDVDLFALVEEMATGVHEGADRGVRLEVRRPERSARLAADRGHLGRAVHSLLTATLRERADPGVILATCALVRGEDGPIACVTVAPREGDGDPAAFSAAEWDPFDQWRGGLGFRLVLAREVIAAHGGTLFSGRGTRARAACAMTLPVKES